MDDYLLHTPKRLISNVVDLFLPKKVTGKERLELIIRLQGENISLRQLAAYMNFIDKAYGRLTPKGISYYSRSSKYELKVTEIRHGSLEIVIANLLSDPEAIKSIVVVGLLLKYMPGIIKSALSAYRDYEEGRLARIQRQQIKEQIEKDSDLKKLKKGQINQLSKFFDLMYGKDIRNLPRAHKFSKETVIEVKIKIEKPKEQLQEQKATRKLRLRRKLDTE